MEQIKVFQSANEGISKLGNLNFVWPDRFHGYIYLFSHLDQNFKIGRAKNVRERLRVHNSTCQGYANSTIRLFAVSKPIPRVVETENTVIEILFKNFKIRFDKEWFYGDPFEALNVLEPIVNWQFIAKCM